MVLNISISYKFLQLNEHDVLWLSTEKPLFILFEAFDLWLWNTQMIENLNILHNVK